MPLTPSLRHCSNKYKLAREGEKGKEKDEDIKKNIYIYIYIYIYILFNFFLFMMKSSSVERLMRLNEFSVVARRLTGIQHSGWGREDHSTSQEW